MGSSQGGRGVFFGWGEIFLRGVQGDLLQKGGGDLLKAGGVFFGRGGSGVLVRRGGTSLGGKGIFCPLRLMLP